MQLKAFSNLSHHAFWSLWLLKTRWSLKITDYKVTVETKWSWLTRFVSFFPPFSINWMTHEDIVWNMMRLSGGTESIRVWIDEQSAGSDGATSDWRRSKTIWACVQKSCRQIVDDPVTEASERKSQSSRNFRKLFHLYVFILSIFMQTWFWGLGYGSLQWNLCVFSHHRPFMMCW